MLLALELALLYRQFRGPAHVSQDTWTLAAQNDQVRIPRSVVVISAADLVAVAIEDYWCQYYLLCHDLVFPLYVA